ncbi:RNA polymerase sigma-70 factor [uncultured Bacteroides sp.]|uniref:RNA polymerase sigma-70 factor n=1 Tax=uncultured Bacteroides sp. TaxID=162156 RepID=UPI002AA77011|nr:RNA polymerase sigma-70 factor [uncultured Bacteroides sp.]
MDDEFEIIYKSLFHKYYSNLLFYATRIVGEEEAEDLVQEVFVDLWRRKDTMILGEEARAFLYRAVYTRSLNVLKHRKVRDSYEAVMMEINQKRVECYGPDDHDVVKRIEDRELRTEIVAAINELPAKCKTVFKLKYLHHMKSKDVAEAMNISSRTVEAHMYNALKFLREKLKYLNLLLVLFF